MSVSLHGSQIVNEDLLNQRLLFAILGVGCGIGGAVLLGVGISARGQGVQPTGAPVPAAPPPPPIKPSGFVFTMLQAMDYEVPQGTLTPSISPAQWKVALERELKRLGKHQVYGQKQINWGYALSLPPGDFVEFVEYIENARRYVHHTGYPIP